MQRARPLPEAERFDWLRLYRSENVGPTTFFRLLERFGSARKALEALPELARQGGRKKPPLPYDKAATAREFDALERIGADLICAVEPDFPTPLAALQIAPILICRGDRAILRRPSVAVVGARNASSAGRRLAHMIAEGLGGAGFVVTSGLARGIDAAAHAATLETGATAVLAGGVDDIYPPENADLYWKIVDKGCVVSEMPPGAKPQAAHFPRRNRLISGLSLGTLVVEATERSGSLITTRLALEQGREVFAVPGSPLDPRSKGPNRLIREGATLVETADDIIFALSGQSSLALAEDVKNDGFPPVERPAPDNAELEEARRVLLSALSPSPVLVDEILRQCQFSGTVLSVCLLELELAGRLERHPGNKVSLCC